MKVRIKPVVTGKKPEPMSKEYREAVRTHARENRYNPDADPVLQEFVRRIRSVRVSSR